MWCTLGWRACSRRRAAAGPDTDRTEPIAGPHSGATCSGGDATPPPGQRETYKGGGESNHFCLMYLGPHNFIPICYRLLNSCVR